MKKKIILFIIVGLVLVGTAVSENTMNALTRGLADTLYCAINECSGDTNMYLNIEDSFGKDVLLNVSSSEQEQYTIKVRTGRHFVFGGEFT